MDASEIKKNVGFALVDREFDKGFLKSGSADRLFRIGLGTGTTAVWAIRKLAELFRDGKLSNIVCVSTSLSSQLEAQKYGLPVSDLNDPRVDGAIDWSFDGADQVDPHGYLIKGGGAAHAREKIIASVAGRFIVVVDKSKIVHRLGGDPMQKPGTSCGTCNCGDGMCWEGNAFAVPVEVLPLALSPVMKAVEAMGARVSVRESKGKIGAVISDNGLCIIDAVFKEGLVSMTDTDPVALELAIKALPGVLDVGIFTLPVALAYVGQENGEVLEVTFEES